MGIEGRQLADSRVLYPMSIEGRRFFERWLIRLIAAQSLGVMVLLTFIPRLTVELGGFGPIEDVFFVRQGGVFHLVVAVGYLEEYRRYRGTFLLLFAKAVAVVFLAWAILFLSASPLVGLALVGDLAMGLMVLVVGRWVQAAEG